MKNKSKGISLVALIITIIVLIILTGTVVMTVQNNNPIMKAKEAVFKNDITSYQDELLRYEMNKKLKVETEKMTATETNATTEEEIKNILPDFKSEYNGVIKIVEGKIVSGDNITNEDYTKWLQDLNITTNNASGNLLTSKAQVGDFVAYNPGTGNATSLQTENGSSDQTFSASNYTGKWEVLYNDGEKITLISSESIGNLTLLSSTGWNNIKNNMNTNTTTIDKICRAYVNSDFATDGRSVNWKDDYRSFYDEEEYSPTNQPIELFIEPLKKDYSYFINQTRFGTAGLILYALNNDILQQELDYEIKALTQPVTYGVRPVIILKNDILTTRKDSNNAWIIQ